MHEWKQFRPNTFLGFGVRSWETWGWVGGALILQQPPLFSIVYFSDEGINTLIQNLSGII